MNSFDKRCSRVLTPLLLSITLGLPALAAAQQKSLSIEELEAYIAEQKSVLEEVRANREETARKADEVREALAEQESRLARVEQELDTLCKERDSLQEGSYEECRSNDQD